MQGILLRTRVGATRKVKENQHVPQCLNNGIAGCPVCAVMPGTCRVVRALDLAVQNYRKVLDFLTCPHKLLT